MPHHPAYDHRLAESDLPHGAVVAALEVDNPLAGSGSNRRNLVTRSLRDDPLGRLHARHQIDDADYAAGRAWQALYEAAEVGRVGAMDPSRVFVDSGRIAEPLNERQRKASIALSRIDRRLGMEGADLVRDILGAGMTMAQAASRRGGIGERYQRYLAQRLRECLGTVGAELGMGRPQRSA